VALCAIVLALGLARGQSAELMVITAISLVVAAVPESLSVVVTLAHALGARPMTARNALAAVIWALLPSSPAASAARPSRISRGPGSWWPLAAHGGDQHAD